MHHSYIILCVDLKLRTFSVATIQQNPTEHNELLFVFYLRLQVYVKYIVIDCGLDLIGTAISKLTISRLL